MARVHAAFFPDDSEQTYLSPAPSGPKPPSLHPGQVPRAIPLPPCHAMTISEGAIFPLQSRSVPLSPPLDLCSSSLFSMPSRQFTRISTVPGVLPMKAEKNQNHLPHLSPPGTLCRCSHRHARGCLEPAEYCRRGHLAHCTQGPRPPSSLWGGVLGLGLTRTVNWDLSEREEWNFKTPDQSWH